MEPVDSTRTTDIEKREDDSDSSNDDKSSVQTPEDKPLLRDDANKKERSLSRDNAARDSESPTVEDPPTTADVPAVAQPDSEIHTDRGVDLEIDDAGPSSSLANRENDVEDVDAPVPFQDAANAQAGPQTPPSSSKVRRRVGAGTDSGNRVTE